MEITGLGRSSIYKFISEGAFPQSISLGERAVAWELSEVEEWVLMKVEGRNKALSESANFNSKHSVTEKDAINFINQKFSQLTVTDAIVWLTKVFNNINK